MARARRERRRGGRPAAASGPASAARGHGLALLLAAFAGTALLIYGPALEGPFFSDDSHYVAENAYLHSLTPENLLALVDPTSEVPGIVENYAPVHLLLHAVEWQLFGEDVQGYHVVNVLLHALAALLLVRLFARTGVPPAFAALGGAVFLCHPANVEAVAWISQLKTSSSMVLALVALLALPKRPGLGTLAFALALLAKPPAVVALPVAGALAWARSGADREAQGDPPRWGWLAVWVGVLAVFAVAEFAAFARTAGQAPPLYPELDVRLRTTVALVARYAAMAVTTRGLSLFHEPPPADSWLDPWWLAGLALVLGVGARTLLLLRARRLEAAWWLWAAAGFAPVSGVIPLPFPMADRYLYFILPGLIGGLLLAVPEALRALAAARARHSAQAPALPARLRRGLRWAAAAMLVLFVGVSAVRSHDRARLWAVPQRLMAEAARTYPDGAVASLQAARRAARLGDADAAVEALRNAHRRGYNRVDHLMQDPIYAGLHGHPGFQRLVRRMATDLIERLGGRESSSQIELHAVAFAHFVRDEPRAALRTLERAVRVGGPITEQIRSEIPELRAQLEAGGDAGDPPGAGAPFEESPGHRPGLP